MSRPSYRPTAADRRPLPASYRAEARHQGYDADESKRPFAAFFRERTLPVQTAAAQTLAAVSRPTIQTYGVGQAANRLSAAGYEEVENGWALAQNGTLQVSVLTDMPRATAAMWDWWFGWHSTDSARYKLWHPDAHIFAALGEDRSADRSLDDRARYRGNVSYVDEFIGPKRQRLAIRFFDPALAGFEDRPETTVIAARVGSSDLPVAAGWLFHQVRPTERGAEMRSRFFLGYPELLDLPEHAVGDGKGSRPMRSRLLRPLVARAVAGRVRGDITEAAGRELFEHCAQEMNHLASFLPELHAEFQDSP